MDIIPNLKKPKSLGRWDLYQLVVTERRSMFALTTGDMLKEAARAAQEAGKAEGKGFMQRWSDQIAASVNYAKKYWTIQPDDIIRESPGNFAIENSSVTSVSISRERERNSGQTYYEMKIQTGAGNFSFRTDYDPEENLRKVYGVRVKRSFW